MPTSILPRTKVVIDLESWQTLNEFVRQCDVEINGFGLVDYDRARNTLRISDVFVTKQTGSATLVDVSDADLHRHLHELLEKGIDISRINFQWHSHVNMEVYFSNVDEANIGRWTGNYLVSLVMNKRGEWKCRLDVFKPLRFAQEVDLAIEWPFADAEIQDRVSADIEQNVKKHPASPQGLFPGKARRKTKARSSVGSKT